METFLNDDRGEGEECCYGIIGIIIVLAIIQYIVMLIMSIFIQILIIAIIVFTYSRVTSKQNKILKWVQPIIHHMTESEISHSVFLNIFAIAPLHNKYSSKNNDYLQLENKIQILSNDIKEKSAAINKNENQINILKNSKMSAITMNEIDLLSDANFKEMRHKDELINESTTLKNSLVIKQDELDGIREEAYVIITKKTIDKGTKIYADDETKIY